MTAALNGDILLFVALPILVFLAYKIGQTSTQLGQLCDLVSSIERVLTRYLEIEIESLPPPAASKMRATMKEEGRNHDS